LEKIDNPGGPKRALPQTSFRVGKRDVGLISAKEDGGESLRNGGRKGGYVCPAKKSTLFVNRGPAEKRQAYRAINETTWNAREPSVEK